MTTIDQFYKRLKKIGIEVELVANYPWIYLDKVNGKKVHGKLYGNHGFTVFFVPVRLGGRETITDIPKIFAKIRETLNIIK